MNDELLARSFRALRESADGTSVDANHTREEILSRLRVRGGRRRRVTWIALPLAAALIVGTAWAAMTGHLPFGPKGAAQPISASTLAATTARASAERPPASAPEAQLDVAPRSSASASASPLVAPLVAPPVPSSAREQSLYTRAHHAHFTERDAEAALRGWNDYLAAFPNGRFALEARYNRAICLVRTGRRDEARAELAPFAAGEYGGYRRAEARDLLDAMTDPP